MSSEGLSRGTRTDAEDPGDQPAQVSGQRVGLIAFLVIASFALTAGVHYGIPVEEPGQYFAGGVFFVLSLLIPTMIAMFGIYWLRGLIRDALAVSVFVAYFSILFHFVTFGFGLGEESTATTLLNNFTALTTTVAIFYFGSVATVEVAKQLFPTGRTSPPVSTNTDVGATKTETIVKQV